MVPDLIRVHNASLLEFHTAGDARALRGRDGALGVIELIDGVADVLGELVGGDIPVDDFGVGIAERQGLARGGGGVEGSSGVGVEGRES